MKQIIAVLLSCLFPVAALANTQETENFMLGVKAISPVLHDTLNDAAAAYKQKCGMSADVPTLKAIANSSPDFSKMLALKSLFEDSANISSSRVTAPFTPTALREYEEAAKRIPCMIGAKPN